MRGAFSQSVCQWPTSLSFFSLFFFSLSLSLSFLLPRRQHHSPPPFFAVEIGERERRQTQVQQHNVAVLLATRRRKEREQGGQAHRGEPPRHGRRDHPPVPSSPRCGEHKTRCKRNAVPTSRSVGRALCRCLFSAVALFLSAAARLGIAVCTALHSAPHTEIRRARRKDGERSQPIVVVAHARLHSFPSPSLSFSGSPSPLPLHALTQA